MNPHVLSRRRFGNVKFLLGFLMLGLLSAAAVMTYSGTRSGHAPPREPRPRVAYQPKVPVDAGGFNAVLPVLDPWKPEATLEEISRSFDRVGYRLIEKLDRELARPDLPEEHQLRFRLMKAALFNYEGEPRRAAEQLDRTRAWVADHSTLDPPWRYSILYFQGVTALRQGENDNCIDCRGESSCIIPIAPAAVHANPQGSRQAIGFFREYLEQFPDDLEVRWLLNLAHMTLGEYPDRVEGRYRINLDRFIQSEFDIGAFRDVGHAAGLDRMNQSGGAVMDDFDGDDRLDLAVTSTDPLQAMAFYHNRGDGTFEDRSQSAGVLGQRGGLVCYQTDYNNDGKLDLFIPRGAWYPYPMRPTLLRNDGGARFTDVTESAGLLHAVNSITACWADYDNDGRLDLFVGCERQPHRLYHNRGDGTFEEVAARAGLAGEGRSLCRGSTWIDFDNDRFPDLFLDYFTRNSRLFRNNRDGTFSDVTTAMGIDGPGKGFSCWAWDYDNDGWLDIFATCYDATPEDVVRGLLGQPHSRRPNRLFHNQAGRRFEDRTKAAGLDLVFATMGSNFGDFDNDGFLDFYLGTGDPNPATLIPNRLFKNVGGARFAEITGTSRTGHLQKGHAVACGDYDGDGDVDIFIELGGIINGDRYHNVLFQNPGQGNHGLTIKLVGRKTNRAAIGARIQVVTAGDRPMTVHRHVSSGSSFGANPLRQTIGLGGATRIAELRVEWPTSGTTQVFRDIAADQVIEITEFADGYRRLAGEPSSRRDAPTGIRAPGSRERGP